MRRRTTVLAGALLAVALAATSGAARAQSAQDKAAADVLFQQGKRLMQESKFAEACPKFAESLRLDTGIGTMLWLADCYERTGKTASAWAEFQEAAGTAATQKDAREKVARQRAASLEPKLVRLKIVVPDANEVSGLEVRRDGSLLGKPLWGTAAPVDPGAHEVVAQAPGYKTWSAAVDVDGEGSTVPLTIPKLAEDVAAASPRAGAAPRTELARRWSPQRTWSLVALGAGVAGVGAGAVFGLNAMAKLDDSNADGHCRADNHCDAVGVQARSDAKDAATMSTLFFAAGGVALVAGAVLWFTAPKTPKTSTAASAPQIRVAPAAGRAGGGVEVIGTF